VVGVVFVCACSTQRKRTGERRRLFRDSLILYYNAYIYTYICVCAIRSCVCICTCQFLFDRSPKMQVSGTNNNIVTKS
jgi:hypothetical protein